jgi:hypothetical protein
MNTDMVPDLTLVSVCGAYAIVSWVLLAYRVVSPREWLLERIKTLDALLPAGSVWRPSLDWFAESLGKPWWRLPTSKVQAGWRHIHRVEDEVILDAPGYRVIEQLKSAQTRLEAVKTYETKALVERIKESLKKSPGGDERRALLRESQVCLHDLSDGNHEDLAALLAKAVWLTTLALAIVVGLGFLFDRETYFLLGGAGALISRLTRVLRRRPKAADYGAAWSTLILSPAGGAIAGWIAVLIAATLAGDPLNALDDAFAVPWDNAESVLGLGIAFVGGFSERWFGRLLGVAETQLGGKLPKEEAEPEPESA